MSNDKKRGAGWFAKWFLFGLALSAVLIYFIIDLSNKKVARDAAERERQWQESRQDGGT